MADQDELVQVGSETMIEESMAQDSTFQGDHSLQPYPEVKRATASITMLEDPLHQISLTDDLVIPIGSTPDHSRSAPPKPLDTDQFMEIMRQMMKRMELVGNQQRSDMQTLRGGMKKMDWNMQTLKAGQEEKKAELAKVKGKMQNMVRNRPNGIRTGLGEMTELRGSVEAVRTAMTTGKVEVTSDATIIKGETSVSSDRR